MRQGNERHEIRLFTMLVMIGSLLPMMAQSPITAPRFTQFTTDDGLCHNRIRSICEDDDGFLWIGTEYGISRFDGSQFVNYFPWPTPTLNAPKSLVTRIVKDQYNRIWFSRGNNSICLDKHTGTWHNFTVDSLPDGTKLLDPPLNTFFLDGRWRIIHPKGHLLYSYDLFTGRHSQLNIDSLLVEVGAPPRKTNFMQFGERPDRSWFLMYTGGLVHLDSSSHVIRYYPIDLEYGGVLNVNSDNFYFQMWQNGYFRLDAKEGHLRNFVYGDPPDNLEDIVHGILVLDSTHKWVATEKGLYSVDEAAMRSVPLDLGGTGEIGTACLVIKRTQSGHIWVGSEQGLFHYDPFTAGFEYHEAKLATAYTYENPIFDIDEDHDNNRLYITSRGGALGVVTDTGTIELSEKISVNPEFMQLHQDSDGIWWLLSRNQLYHFDPNQLTLTPVPTPTRRSPHPGLIWQVKEDSHKRLWFGMSRDGLWLYDMRTRDFQYITCEEHGLCDVNVMDLVIDELHQQIWVATHTSGVWVSDLTDIHFKNLPIAYEGQYAKYVYSIDVDALGNIWMAAVNGLLRLNTDTPGDTVVTFLGIESGLPEPQLTTLLYDGRDHIWTATTGKLISINIRSLEITVYDHEYGVDISPLAIYTLVKGAYGYLYAGGRTGYLKWKTAALRKDTAIPNMYIDRIDVPGDSSYAFMSTKHQTSLRLPNHRNQLTIHFGAIDFSSSHKNKYTWKLEGYDDTWQTGTSPVTYTRLPPGKYVFTAAIMGQEEYATHMSIQIVPAFWQTIYFKIGMTLLLLLASLLFYKWRMRLYREKEAIRSQLSQRIAEVEMKALRAQINPHFIFNCLNSINRFIQMRETDTASLYLTKFARLIRLALDLSRDNLVPLDKELELITLYIEMENLRFTGRFSWEIKIDPAVDPSSIAIPPMILQPYIENAIWHGLMNLHHDNGELSIVIEPEGDDLLIRIEDNGIGREAAARMKSKQAVKHKSFGMALTSERLKLFQHQSGRNIKVTVEDLVLANGSPGGTAVIITLSNFES
jgi:ligand-binding sensor domain-containing protein